MSDEPSRGWFPRELHSIWMALIAGALVVHCVIALRFSSQFDGRGFGFLAMIGLVACGFGRHLAPYRCLGLAPPMATWVVMLAAWQVIAPEAIGSWLFGLTLGGVFGGTMYHVYWMKEQAGPGDEPLLPALRLVNVLLWAGAVLPVGALLFLGLSSRLLPPGDPDWQLVVHVYFLVGCVVLCVWCWLMFLRPFVELCLEPFARLLYRVRSKGQLNQVPAFGPCVVIANHAFWFDPCVLGVMLPRPITPIMTARFFNVWFLRPLLKHVFRVIVVPETAMKRDTPEVDGAIAALDRGEVVVIFPEGYLRRKEEVPLRRFGQGVWRILAARPGTPVVPCWIEGGWGSKFSYKDGPPGAKGKKMDLRRKIDVGVLKAEVVPAEVLANGIDTRIHLMNRVGAARGELGLEPLPPFDLPATGEPASSEESA